MRVLNSVLHCVVNLLFVLLLLGAMGRAQTQGNIPDAIDSAMDGIIGGTSGSITYPEAIAIGDEIVACAYSDNSGPFAVTDTLANTWTCTSPVTTPGIFNPTLVYMCYTHSTSAGADTLSMAPGKIFGALTAGRFANLSGVLDSTLSTATATGSGSSATLSTSTTTTVNGSLGISCSAAGGINDRLLIPSTNEYVVNEPGQGRSLLTQHHTTALGSQSDAIKIWGTGATFAMATLYFKPSPSIYLTDTVMPDAAAGIAYSAQLHGVGGIAGLTYACTGLPSNGLSLNTGTGVISGATPTLGTVSLSCTVTDGTTTSLADVLSIKIAGGFNTPAIRNIATGSFDTGTTLSVPAVGCGDVIAVSCTGVDTHNGEGWLSAVSGANNYIRDSYGSPVKRVIAHGGVFSSPLVTFLVGPVLTPGVDVITGVNNQNASSCNEVTAIDWSGVQSVVDLGTVSAELYTTGSGSLGTTLTTVVPNEVAVATSMNGGVHGPLSTQTIGAPYGVVNLNGDLLIADATIAAAGSTTATVSLTSPNSLDTLGNSLWALRPGITNSSCATFVGAGEKIRRQVW